ncbi:hypothetical protein ILUMI_22568 [Ignelater luminosus]|uniref:Uncharacterized protein n=1 Tax=Ignelater luminosus TaxID=2038154 RepID=A0A8K0CE74_IGNLU|nr:hypothetical protein ILUMI_22568 [Ignelater luminosus]
MELSLTALVVLILSPAWAFNGELAELECPDDCDCHYFRVNWVTDCSDSNLTDIPYDELSPNVYFLDVNSNRITDVKPFPPDIKIRRLHLADNLITELRKESFATLNILIDADFSENRITRVDPNTFEGFAGFSALELQGNPLEPIDGVFLSSNKLMYLDISNCGLTRLHTDFFSNITALTTLDLSGNPLREIGSFVFEPLTSLETLKMNKCNLTYISYDAFKFQTNLKTLELADNMLTSLDWPRVFESLVRLEYLDLRNSSVTNIQENSFNNNNYLRTLILAENKLTGFDVASTLGQKLYELDTLDLSFCSLDKPLSEDAFSNTTKLRVLNLSGNSLFASDLLVALAPLVGLQKLGLSNCGLSRLPDTFHKFKSLQELDISHNPLNDVFIKLIAPIDTLEYLNMGYSNLSYISATTFSQMTNMKRLVLSGNDLNNLEAGLFGGLKRLESLELNNCGLRRPLNATLFFNNLTYHDLKELQLAGNPLQVSPELPLFPKKLSRLEVVDLNNCNLSFLPTVAFFYCRNIARLSLLGNHLTSDGTSLSFVTLLPQLRMLDLRYNNLTTLTPAQFSENPNIEKLKLVGNPWKCDCSVAELWDWAQLHKGNLGLLEGSTIEEEHTAVGNKVKRKKLLICNYDASVQMPMVVNKTAAGRRPFIKQARLLTSTNRTWAKYVRESGCEQKPIRSRFERSVKSVPYEEILIESSKRHVPNTWAPAAITALVIYVFLMGCVGTFLICTRRKTRIS